MKRFILFLILLSSSTFSAFSQIYDYWRTYYYIKVGESVETAREVYIAHFDRDGNAWIGTLGRSAAIDKYNKGILDEYPINLHHTFKYDSEISTYKYTVYSKRRVVTTTGMPTPENPWGQYTSYPGGNWYRAFSKDMGEMIYWQTTKTSNEAQNRTYYKRIDPSDLIPPKVNYDFL